jgi:hypothetical protein
MNEVSQHDLQVLTADKDTEHALRALFRRPEAFGVRPFTYEMTVHPYKDSGCVRAAEFLRPFVKKFAYVLVVFDREGSGKEHEASREEIEREIELGLDANGWQDRAAVIVLDPEIESWVWSPSPHVDEALGWARRSPSLREWLTQRGYLREGETKPARPKEAMRAALQAVRRPPSAALFEQIASKVSVARCEDPSFTKLRKVLQHWFATA